MDESIKQRWVNTLRSGNYNQQEGALRMLVTLDNGEPHMGYCCLGVLCEIVEDKDSDEIWQIESSGDHWSKYGIPSDLENPDTSTLFSEYPPDRIQSLTELQTNEMETLADMNDNGASFEDIADWIEENL